MAGERIPVQPPSLRDKLICVISAAKSGGRDHIPSPFLEIINYPFSDREYEASDKQKYFNPEAEKLEDQFNSVIGRINHSKSPRAIRMLPWDRRVFSPSLFISRVMTLCGQGENQSHEDVFPVKLLEKYAEYVTARSKELKRPLTLVEQYKISLELADNDPFGAAVICARGSRMAGRGEEVEGLRSIWVQEGNGEKEAVPEILTRMIEWRTCVCPFEGKEGEFIDPVGDTDHFWDAVVGSMANKCKYHFRDYLLDPFYGLFYNNIAFFTKMSHKFFGERKNDFLTHEAADRLGWRTGKRLMEMIRNSYFTQDENQSNSSFFQKGERERVL